MKEIKIEMNEVIKTVHNKIAIWVTNFNKGVEDENGLKIISQEIVEDVLKEAVKGMGGSGKSGIEIDPDATKQNISKDFNEFQKDLQDDQESSDSNFNTTSKKSRFS